MALLDTYKNGIKHGFREQMKNGVLFYTVPSFDAAGFVGHGFTSRIGGVSGGCYESLNLSRTRENSAANKEENYRRVCRAIDSEYEKLAIVNYNHGDGVYHAGDGDAGKGFVKESDLPHCDAMTVDGPGVTAVTLSADCVPVFYADVKKKKGAVCHAGWRGVLHGLPGKVVGEMMSEFESRPEDIMIGIGPHILGCCFEVQKDVRVPFEGKFGSEIVREREGKTFIDLEEVVLRQLDMRGVPATNVTVADLCTCCDEAHFYSVRRDGMETGAMGSFLYIKG